MIVEALGTAPLGDEAPAEARAALAGVALTPGDAELLRRRYRALGEAPRPRPHRRGPEGGGRTPPPRHGADRVRARRLSGTASPPVPAPARGPSREVRSAATRLLTIPPTRRGRRGKATSRRRFRGNAGDIFRHAVALLEIQCSRMARSVQGDAGTRTVPDPLRQTRYPLHRRTSIHVPDANEPDRRQRRPPRIDRLRRRRARSRARSLAPRQPDRPVRPPSEGRYG